MKRTLFAIPVFLLLVSCAPKTVFVIPGGGTQEEQQARFQKDKRECIYEGKRAAGPMGGGDILWAAYMSNQLAKDCMISRGYIESR